MREIKFRAWNKEKNIMCYNDEDNDSDYWDGVIGSILEIINENLKTKRYIFEQYTGLKDKNGKEIYEGDILRNTKEHYTGQVVFKDGCFMSDCAGWGMRPLLKEDSFDIKMIGNIHENPELLK